MSTSTYAVGRTAAPPAPNLPFIIGASSGRHADRVVRLLPLWRARRVLRRALLPRATMRNGFLFSLAIFWTGFVVRPFGAIVFGHIGDLIGRKFTFMLTLGSDGRRDVPGRLPADL